jgi:hypothetical protein
MIRNLTRGLTRHLTRSLSPGGESFDADALAYIAAVETEDAQPLESAVRLAVNAFVRGCKADASPNSGVSNWDAIKASCILTGPRTLAGALVPLKGPAPTNVGPFVSDDYNRETGIVGNGTTKYLNSNRAGNTDPQNNFHLGIWISTAQTPGGSGVAYAGNGTTGSGSSQIVRGAAGVIAMRSRSGTGDEFAGLSASTGFMGQSRNAAASYNRRIAGTTSSVTRDSESPLSQNIAIFGRNLAAQSDARIAYYSIGEAITLDALDARLATYIAAINAAIP